MSNSGGYKSTLEWGFWKFIKYLVTLFVVAWISSWILTRFANLDIIAWNWLVAAHLANLWLFIPESITVIGAVFIFRWGRRTEKRDKYKRYLNHIAELNKTASSEVKKDNK